MRLKPLFFLLILLLSSCKKEIPTNSISNKKNLRRETNSITINKKDSVETKLIQKERFDFETELCSNKGYFDSNKYSREEIKDTYKLWFQSGGIAMSTPSVFKLADLYKVRSEKDLILKKSHPIDLLLKKYPENKESIKLALEKITKNTEKIKWLPFQSRKSTSWVILIEGTSADILGFLPYDGF